MLFRSYNTWLHMPSLSAFTTTGYGQALLGKLIWVAITMSVAFINWRKVLPELTRFRAGVAEQLKWLPRFSPLLQAEFAGCVIIFATVAMLTNLPPATADPSAGPRELKQKSGSTEVALRIEPGKLGQNQVSLSLADGAGKPLTNVKKVMVYLRMMDMDMGLTSAEAVAQPLGGFAADAVFSMSGHWKVSVEVTPGSGDAFVVEYDVTIL